MDDIFILLCLFAVLIGVFVKLTILLEAFFQSLVDPHRSEEPESNFSSPRGKVLGTVHGWRRLRFWRNA